jgi:hypothetical protein
MMALIPFAVSVGQESFKLAIKTPQPEIAGDLIQLDNGNYIITGFRLKNNVSADSKGMMWLVNAYGILIDSVEISKQDTIVYLSKVQKYGSNYLISGKFAYYTNSDRRNFPVFYVVDSTLKLLNEYRIPLDSNYSFIESVYPVLAGDELYIGGNARNRNYTEYYNDLFICKYDLQTHVLQSNFLELTGEQSSTGYLKTSNYHIIFSHGGWGYPPGYSSGYYVLFDSNLNWLVTDSLPNDIRLDNSAINLTDSTYLLSGRQSVFIGPPSIDEERSVLYEMAFPNQAIRSFEYHMGTDTLSFPAGSSIDTTCAGEIYFSGTANVIPYEAPFQHTPSWIFLSKLDRDLNPIWTKLYGGDMFYQVYSVKATQDGGAIMACRTYDYLTQDHEHDILIMKVNEDGLIVGTGEELPKIPVQDAIVYPNPGNEYFTIQSGPQISGALFELFDLSGNLVLTTTLDERVETISTIRLSTGTYPYRITFDNKIVGSGKWVKQ